MSTSGAATSGGEGIATGGRATCGKSPTGAGGADVTAGCSGAGGGGDGSTAGGGADAGCVVVGVGSRVTVRCGAVDGDAAGWCAASTGRGALRRVRGTVAAERCARFGSCVPPSIRTGAGAPTSRVPLRCPGASTNQLHARSIRPDAPSVPTTGRAPVTYAGLIMGEARRTRSPWTCACRRRLSTIRTTQARRIPPSSESIRTRFGGSSSRKLRKASRSAVRKISRRRAPYSYRHLPLNSPACSHRRRRRPAAVLAACDAPAGGLRGA